GTLSILRTHWRAILLPRRKGLRLEQRIQYFLACTHYLSGLRDLIYIVSPLAFLVTGVPAVRGATLGLFLWHFLPYFFAAQSAFWYVAWKKTSLRGIIIGFGSFPTLIHALLMVVRGQRGRFLLTAKQRRTTQAWSHLVIYLAGLLCCLAGSGVGLTLKQGRRESVVISVLWVIYDSALLVSFLRLGIADVRYREAPSARGQRAHIH